MMRLDRISNEKAFLLASFRFTPLTVPFCYVQSAVLQGTKSGLSQCKVQP